MTNHDQTRRQEIEAKHPINEFHHDQLHNWHGHRQLNYFYEDMINMIIRRTTWRQLAQKVMGCQATKFGALK